MIKKEKASDKATVEDIELKDQEVSADQAGEESTQEDPMEKLKAELDTEKDRYLRLFAEFENYKRRTGKERIELFKTAGEDIMISLLPVLDDFDRALKEIEKTEDDEHFKGVQLISNKFRETLRSKGLEPIGTKKGDKFDPEIHEAVSQIPAPSKKLKGKIIDIIETGYMLGDKIIRFPKVVIGQ